MKIYDITSELINEIYSSKYKEPHKEFACRLNISVKAAKMTFYAFAYGKTFYCY